MWNHSNLQHTRFIFGTHFCIYNKTYSLYVPVLLWRDIQKELLNLSVVSYWYFYSAAHSSYFPRFSPTVLVDWRTALPEDEMDAAAADKKDKIFVNIGVKNQQKDKIFVNISIKINKKTKSSSISASWSTKRQNLCHHRRQKSTKT